LLILPKKVTFHAFTKLGLNLAKEKKKTKKTTNRVFSVSDLHINCIIVLVTQKFITKYDLYFSLRIANFNKKYLQAFQKSHKSPPFQQKKEPPKNLIPL
jgi:antitoxin component of RelBE/YafQ-DinJ toxin-antitoxin module